jgi:hypothetical protein
MLNTIFNLNLKKTTTSKSILTDIHKKLNKISPNLLNFLGKAQFLMN